MLEMEEDTEATQEPRLGSEVKNESAQKKQELLSDFAKKLDGILNVVQNAERFFVQLIQSQKLTAQEIESTQKKCGVLMQQLTCFRNNWMLKFLIYADILPEWLQSGIAIIDILIQEYKNRERHTFESYNDWFDKIKLVLDSFDKNLKQLRGLLVQVMQSEKRSNEEKNEKRENTRGSEAKNSSAPSPSSLPGEDANLPPSSSLTVSSSLTSATPVEQDSKNDQTTSGANQNILSTILAEHKMCFCIATCGAVMFYGRYKKHIQEDIKNIREASKSCTIL